METGLRLSAQNYADIRRAIGTLNADRVMRASQTEEAANRHKARNIEKNVVGLSTDALGVTRGRVKCATKYNTLPLRQSGKKVGTSSLLADFSAPAMRKHQIYSVGGQRSFHFAVTAIPKTAKPRTLRDGTKIGPNAAADNVRYAEGEGKTGADERNQYLDSDKVQQDEDGSSFVPSNISKVPSERIEFFDLAEKKERNASVDSAKINFLHDPRLWSRIVDDPACDPAVVRAWLVDRERAATVELTRGADSLETLMRKHGFEPAKSEDPLRKLSLKQRAKLEGIAWKRGRGGRTQWRIIFALPKEFNADQRAEAVKAVCARLEASGAMYMAVIHEPVASNDPDNFHVHIDFYDRPCRRFRGDAIDVKGVREGLREEIAAEISRGDFDDQIGKWNFTVERTYKSSSGNKVSHRPFRANKCQSIRKYSFIKSSRKEIADIVNAIAVKHGLPPLYDARSYKEMGIEKVAGVRLGPKCHGLECKGIPTERGLLDEGRQADYGRGRIEDRYAARMSQLTQLEKTIDDGTVIQRLYRVRRDEMAAAAALLEEQRLAADGRRALELDRLEIDRQRSRALLVLRTAYRVRNEGSTSSKANATQRIRESEAYLGDWASLNSPHLDKLENFQTTLRLLENDGDDRLRRVTEFLTSPLTAEEREAFKDRMLNASAGTIDEVLASSANPGGQGNLPDVALQSNMPAHDAKTLDLRVDSPAIIEPVSENEGIVEEAARQNRSLPSDDAGSKQKAVRSPGTDDRPRLCETEEGRVGDAKAHIVNPTQSVPVGPGPAGLISHSLPDKAQDVAIGVIDSERSGEALKGGRDIDRLQASRVEQVEHGIPSFSQSRDRVVTRNGGILTAGHAQRPPLKFDDANYGAAKPPHANEGLSTKDLGRRNIMQTATTNVEAAVTEELPTKTLSMPETHAAIIVNDVPLSWGPLENPIAPATDTPPCAFEAVSGAKSPPLETLTETKLLAHAVEVSEPASATILPRSLNARASIQNDSAGGAGQTDEPRQGDNGDRAELSYNGASRPACPVDLTDTNNATSPFTPDPLNNASVTPFISGLHADAAPSERLRMDVVKENYPASRPLSGEVADRPAVPAEMHLRQPAMPAQPIGNADVSQTVATNTSKDNAVSVVDHMRAAFIVRLEERNVRLADVKGKIVAAPGQPLKRGDEPFIKASQDACRALKERQDALAIAVAKALWMHAEALAAGRSTDIDPLMLLLAEKWVDDAFIAFGLKHVDRQKAIRAAKREATIANAKSIAPLIQRGIPPAQGIGLD